MNSLDDNNGMVEALDRLLSLNPPASAAECNPKRVVLSSGSSVEELEPSPEVLDLLAARLSTLLSGELFSQSQRYTPVDQAGTPEESGASSGDVYINEEPAPVRLAAPDAEPIQ